MKLSRIELSYNGQSFFIDIAEGNMVSLNTIFEISGSPKNQDPSQWVRLEKTKKIIESTNMGKTHILKTKRGVGGGTWAHWQLALSYAQYLSPELHLAVNQVFKERLEETIDPELGINRSRERAIKKWEEQGHDEKWIADRERHLDTRKVYVKTLVEHDVKQSSEIAICTNKIYKGIFNKDRSELEKGIRNKYPSLPKKIIIRDHLKRSSIAAIGLAEALASEEIDEFNVRGLEGCARVSYDKGCSVQKALTDAKAKSPVQPQPEKLSQEDQLSRIQALKDALKPK
jgi:hypothetical protein